MIKNKIKDYTVRILSILLLLLVFTIACEESDDLPKYSPPSDHTKSEDGFLHKSGLEQPLVNCASCHGSDLKGGTSGVSCYECSYSSSLLISNPTGLSASIIISCSFFSLSASAWTLILFSVPEILINIHAFLKSIFTPSIVDTLLNNPRSVY